MTELHPRPQLSRAQFRLLDGDCGFAYDDDNVGRDDNWIHAVEPFDRTIALPFAPESAASGIGETGYHPIVWYRRELGRQDLAAGGLGLQGDRIILHFGAVDHTSDVWVDGTHVVRHVGGQTAFSIDVTHALIGDHHVIVVRAQDDPLDAILPRGKQDWHAEPHAIWYHRSTGIWRSVWLEAVVAVHVTHLAWTPDLVHAAVGLELELSARPAAGESLTIELSHEGTALSRISLDVHSDRIRLDVPIAALRNGQAIDELTWSPTHPRLIDARLSLSSGDAVNSYVGLRSVRVEAGRLLLNDRPFSLRSVLQQGYWPTSHFTAPSVDAMREEIELTKRLGFNSIRIHQKVEDPRYLYWCDRLGLTVWAEAAAAYEFSPRAIELYASEWLRIVRSQQSHPSIIVWVPFNESWGIQHVSHDPAQAAYSRSLADLTRALDPSRPVVANDGWEHTGSDLVTIHDYEGNGDVLRDRYGSAESIQALLAGIGPHGRRMVASNSVQVNPPIMLTEFGGVRYETGQAQAGGWGYSSAATADKFEQQLRAVVGAIHSSPHVVGFCYTQLTDTEQEVNGLCDANRVPKLPEETIRAIMEGAELRSPIPTSTTSTLPKLPGQKGPMS